MANDLGKERADIIRRLRAYRRYQKEATERHAREMWAIEEQKIIQRAARLGIVAAIRVC